MQRFLPLRRAIFEFSPDDFAVLEHFSSKSLRLLALPLERKKDSPFSNELRFCEWCSPQARTGVQRERNGDLTARASRRGTRHTGNDDFNFRLDQLFWLTQNFSNGRVLLALLPTSLTLDTTYQLDRRITTRRLRERQDWGFKERRNRAFSQVVIFLVPVSLFPFLDT